MLDPIPATFAVPNCAAEAQRLGLDEYHLTGPVALPRYSPADVITGYDTVMPTDPYETEPEDAPTWLAILLMFVMLTFAVVLYLCGACVVRGVLTGIWEMRP